MRAAGFLASHPNLPLYTSRVVWGELAEGVTTPSEVDLILQHFTVLEVTRDIAWQAAQAARALKTTGMHVGDNDTWIAGTALAYQLPLVTANTRHFLRVGGLTVVGY